MKTLSDYTKSGHTPNRRERRRMAKSWGLFKKENRGKWEWLKVRTKEDNGS